MQIITRRSKPTTTARTLAGSAVATALLLGMTTMDSLAGDRLAFHSTAPGEYTFDTGPLRGHLGPPGRGNGLSAVVHVPSGQALDRGANGHGLFSHYRVFSDGKRYGTGAWDWPKETRLLPDGAVELRWPPAADRPFQMRAVYRWATPEALDCITTVSPEQDLRGFEIFLASYFAEPFTNAAACTRYSPGPPPAAAFTPATEADGPWQLFPRNAAAIRIIKDGRWQLEPHPVNWKLRSAFGAPLVIRRAPATGLTVVLMAAADDCFGLAMPHETEGHYSMYLSLGGRDLKRQVPVQFRTRLWVTPSSSNESIAAHYAHWSAPAD